MWRCLRAFVWTVESLSILCPLKSTWWYSLLMFWEKLIIFWCRHIDDKCPHRDWLWSSKKLFYLSLSNYGVSFGFFLVAFFSLTLAGLKKWSTDPVRDQRHSQYRVLPDLSRSYQSCCNNTGSSQYPSAWGSHSTWRSPSSRSVPTERFHKRSRRTTNEQKRDQQGSKKKATSIADVLPDS